MNEARLNELMENEEFMAGAENITSAQEAADYLASYGVEVSADELMGATEDELSEDMLDGVAGGGWFGDFFLWLCGRRTEANKPKMDNLFDKLKNRR